MRVIIQLSSNIFLFFLHIIGRPFFAYFFSLFFSVLFVVLFIIILVLANEGALLVLTWFSVFQINQIDKHSISER
jgi:hypothetical protein